MDSQVPILPNSIRMRSRTRRLAFLSRKLHWVAIGILLLVTQFAITYIYVHPPGGRWTVKTVASSVGLASKLGRPDLKEGIPWDSGEIVDYLEAQMRIGKKSQEGPFCESELNEESVESDGDSSVVEGGSTTGGSEPKVKPQRECRQPRYDKNKVAIMIETRPLPSLVPVILYYMSVLREDWPFVVYYTARNAHLFYRSVAIRHRLQSGKLELRQLPVDIPYASYNDISAFLTNQTFWAKDFVGEHILFFQTDSILCANSALDLEDFMGFDWIGAPWPENHANTWTRGGNGGFSLRRRSRMLRVLDHYKWAPGLAEDQFFCEQMATFDDAILPTIKTSSKFSLQFIPNTFPVGIHKEGTKEIEQVEYYCPEAKMLSWNLDVS
ncbi:hypothetical protein DFS34DRAFT_110657 [Phlyctochytrium arcticum]|nr:hypothetical protein DFS34DRAFT_110657 [Phlyctochytrium arcticum]